MQFRRLIKCFFAFAATLALTTAARPIPARDSTPLTCALVPDAALDFANSAAFNLLTVELSKDPALALLERAEVDKVLQERSLTLAMASEGLAERRALGTLLKARLLVILRAGQKQVAGKTARFVNVMISDTAHGLRLVQDQVPVVDENPRALAQSVAGDVARARQRLAEPLAAILAVPPFVSDDLEHRFDYLQEAYARLLTEALSGVPGLRLVELAEARALADEIRLSDGGGKIGRERLPYYLHGRYRNEGRDTTRTVTLALELRQGERPLTQKKSTALAPAAAPGFLRRSTGELLARMLGGRRLDFNPDVETAELARKSRQFEQLGEWEKALSLTETALLLKPEDPALHKAALDLTTWLIDAVPLEPDVGGYETYLAVFSRAVAANVRALDHLDFYLRRGQFERTWQNRKAWRTLEEELQGFWRAGAELYKNAGKMEPEAQRLVSELGRAKRELILSREASPLGSAQPAFAPNFVGWDWHWTGLPFDVSVPIVESPTERLQANFRLIEARLKWSGGRDADFGRLLVALQSPGDPAAYAAFLARVAALPGRQFPFLAQYARIQQETVKDPRRQLDRLNATIAEITRTGPVDKPLERLLELLQEDCRRIGRDMAMEKETERLRREYAAKPQPALHFPPKRPVAPDDDYTLTPIAEIKITPQGWIKCSGGIDLLWDKGFIYRMQRPGALESIPIPAGLGELIDVVFDGRWAWAAFKNRVAVIDPASAKATLFSEPQGVPPGEIMIAPLAPGRVCVVGGFGRAWCATLEFDGSGKLKVDVFHEARLATGGWRDPALAFTPRFAATLQGGDGRPRVLVGRERPDRALYLPLLLDPERRKAEVVPYRLSRRLRPFMITPFEGSLYWLSNTYDLVSAPDTRNGFSYDEVSGPRLRLGCFGPPQMRETTLFAFIPLAFVGISAMFEQNPDAYVPLVCFQDGQCFALKEDCWWIDRQHGRAVKLKGTMPHTQMSQRRLGYSNQYGTVLVAPEYGSEASCFTFRAQANLASRLDGVTPANAAPGRAIAAQDPFDGSLGVLRRLRSDRDDRGFTTLTAPIVGGSLVVEKEGVESGTRFLLAGADQFAPALKLALGAAIIPVFPMDGRSRHPAASDDPYFVRLPPIRKVPGTAGSGRFVPVDPRDPALPWNLPHQPFHPQVAGALPGFYHPAPPPRPQAVPAAVDRYLIFSFPRPLYLCLGVLGIIVGVILWRERRRARNTWRH